MAKEIEYIIGELLTKQRKTLAVAESCTGGLISNLITNVPGSSAYFVGGITAYSNRSKIDLLKVPENIIQEEGAVSKSCAVKMAQNIRMLLHTDIGLGVTGIAGPTGGSIQKPVGSVYVAVSDGEKTICRLFKFDGDRQQIKEKAGTAALSMVRELIVGKR